MARYQRKPYKGKRHVAPIYNIIVNPEASEYSKAKINSLTEEIISSGCRYFLTEPDSPRSCVNHVKKILNKKPMGVIVCGGDSTVNLVARALIRRTIGLGIYPTGKFNNIYRSLYGEPDLNSAMEHILSRQTRKIDCGMASDHFFLGSIAFGLIPELFEHLAAKKLPRFAISWSRLASQAMASVEIRQLSMKVDAFGFEIIPQTLNINLLSQSTGLPLSPSSIDDDGKCEITFDIDTGEAIMSGYIRQIFKKKYIYSDEIRMFRGQRVTISDVSGMKMYLDGEIIELKSPELNIETFPERVRIFHKE